MSHPEDIVHAEAYLSKEEARTLYNTGDAAHDFDHVLRVAELGDHIACAEGADRLIVRLAALLHDVPVDDDDNRLNHGREAHHLAAAAFARRMLSAKGLGTEQAANVVHCIEAHRFRDQTVSPETLEAKCLYDADKLDSIGAIGVGRAFAYAGAHANRLWTEPLGSVSPASAPAGADYTPLHEYSYKLKKLQGSLYTATARSIGAQRAEFMATFFRQLDAEMSGAK